MGKRCCANRNRDSHITPRTANPHDNIGGDNRRRVSEGITMLKLSRSSILRSAIAALCVPGAVLAQQQQQAQTGPQAEQQTLEEITVTGTRIVRSGMVTPVPTTAVQADELQNMSAPA